MGETDEQKVIFRFTEKDTKKDQGRVGPDSPWSWARALGPRRDAVRRNRLRRFPDVPQSAGPDLETKTSSYVNPLFRNPLPGSANAIVAPRANPNSIASLSRFPTSLPRGLDIPQPKSRKGHVTNSHRRRQVPRESSHPLFIIIID